MSNDIKLVAQGALARAASSSAAVNVAHLYPDLGRAFRSPASRLPCREEVRLLTISGPPALDRLPRMSPNF